MSERERRNGAAKRLDAWIDAGPSARVLHRDVVPGSLLTRVAGSFTNLAHLVDSRSDRVIGYAERGLAGLDDDALDAVRGFVVARSGSSVVITLGGLERALASTEIGLVELEATSGAVRLYLDTAALSVESRRRPRALPDTPLVMRILVGTTSVRRAELRELARGDAITLDELWPEAPRASVDGCEATFSLAREGSRVVVVAIDRGKERAMTEIDPDDALVRVDDARVTLSVEIARVATTVAELSRLVPGAVLPVDASIDREVVLRIAGQAIARGAIITVDGAPAVRIDAIANRDQ